MPDGAGAAEAAAEDAPAASAAEPAVAKADDQAQVYVEMSTDGRFGRVRSWRGGAPAFAGFGFALGRPPSPVSALP